MRKASLVIAVTCWGAALLAAQAVKGGAAGATEVAVATASSGGTLKQLLISGGPVMIVLGAMSVLTLVLIFNYLFTLRTNLIVPPALIKQLEGALAKKDYDLMEEACEANGSPAARVIAAGMDVHRRTNGNYAMVRDALEDEGARQAERLWQRIQYLQDIAVLSPLVGLLGTVVGMIQSFIGMLGQDATPRPTVVASGISMALVTTAAGLILGILAMMVYAAFRGRVQRLVTKLETGCGRVSVGLMEPGPGA